MNKYDIVDILIGGTIGTVVYKVFDHTIKSETAITVILVLMLIFLVNMVLYTWSSFKETDK